MNEEEKKIWKFCDKKQREIMNSYNKIDELQRGKIMAYRAIQRLINGDVTDLSIWGRKYDSEIRL